MRYPTLVRAARRPRSALLSALALAAALAACDGKVSQQVGGPGGARLALNTGPAATFSMSSVPFAWSAGSGTAIYQWHAVTVTPAWNATIRNDADLKGTISFQVKDASGVLISDNTTRTRGATWASSNTAVATVARYKDPVFATQDRFDADVTLKAAGTTTLTLTLDPNDSAKKRTMSITLTVTDQRPVIVERIAIDPTTASLQVGQTQRFKVTAYDAANNPYTPLVTVGFSASSNVSLVRVSNYEVDATATAGGTGTVTASAYTFTATATISTPGSLASLSLSPSAGTQVVDGGCTTYTATRKDAANVTTTQGGPLAWSLADPALGTLTASGDQATVCATAGTNPGQTTVVATAGAVSGNAIFRHWRVLQIGLSPTSINATGPTATTVNATVTADFGTGAQALPTSSAGLSLAWSSDDPAIATVSGSARSATVNTLNQTGSTTVRASVGGVTATLPVSVIGALSVTAAGPDYITTKGTYRWEAFPTGGVGSYSYVWEKSVDGGSTWSMLLSTQYSYPIYSKVAELYVGCGSQTLRYRVKVTSSGDGQVAYGYRTTYANVGSYPYTSC